MPQIVRSVGCDVCQVARTMRLWERYGDRFLNRAFHPTEIESIKQMSSTDAVSLFLASRWAAKEAVFKAVGQYRLLFPQIEVVKLRNQDSHSSDPSLPQVALPGQRGSPVGVRLHGKTRDAATAAGVDAVLLSLSHDGPVAFAVALTTAKPARSED